MRSLRFLALFTLFGKAAVAQVVHPELPHYKLAHVPEITEELPPSFFAENREKIRAMLPDSSMAAVFSAPQKFRAAEVPYPFHQDADFYYLTGLNEPNALLLLFSEPMQWNGTNVSELLFVEQPTTEKLKWTSGAATTAQLAEQSACTSIENNTAFKEFRLPTDRVNAVFANRYADIEFDNKTHPGDLMSMVRHFEAKCERAEIVVKVNEFEDLCASLRQNKSEKELSMMRRAINITSSAMITAMEITKPAICEYQVEAAIEYVFRANGASGPAFPSIVASGKNGGTMHYTANESLLIPGQMVIVDIGASYEGYAADVCRTIPVSGTFSADQRAVYNVVAEAIAAGAAAAQVGNKFWAPHDEAFKAIGVGLTRLGIIKKWSEIGDYFIHGSSHYLGLDVHDAGLYGSLQPGQVITIEPGIYIPEGAPCDKRWWNIFVRIENDYLITPQGPELLSAGMPTTAEEVEAAMRRDEAQAP